MLTSASRFPCASWIQGGDGEQGNQRGSIICAASGISCYGSKNAGVLAARKAGLGSNKGEQDWQGTANTKLRVRDILQNTRHTLTDCQKSALLRLYGQQALLGAFQFSTTTMAVPAAATTHAYIAIPNNNPLTVKVKSKYHRSIMSLRK